MENSFILYKGCWISKYPPHRSSYISKDECVSLLNRGGDFVKKRIRLGLPG